ADDRREPGDARGEVDHQRRQVRQPHVARERENVAVEPAADARREQVLAARRTGRVRRGDALQDRLRGARAPRSRRSSLISENDSTAMARPQTTALIIAMRTGA